MSISFSRLREVMKAREYNKFLKWMRGQTVGLEDGECMVYEDDLLRYLNHEPIID